MLKDGKVISQGTVIFSVPKHFKFINPKLSYRIEKDEIMISAESYARSVEIINENDDMLLLSVSSAAWKRSQTKLFVQQIVAQIA